MASKKSHNLLPFAQQRRRPTSTIATLHATRPAVEQIEASRQLSRAIRDAGQRVELGQLQIEILYLCTNIVTRSSPAAPCSQMPVQRHLPNENSSCIG